MIDPGDAAWRRANGDDTIDARADWPEKLYLQAASGDPRWTVPFEAAIVIGGFLPSLPVGKYLPGQFAIRSGKNRKLNPLDTRLHEGLEHGLRHIAPGFE